MNINIKDPLIFIVALFIGYHIYPLLNQQSEQRVSNNFESSSTSINSPSEKLVTQAQRQVDQLKVDVTENKSGIEQGLDATAEMLDESDLLKNDPASKLITTDPIEVKSYEGDPESQYHQDELNNWAEEYRNNLHINFKENVPVSIQEGMLKQVEKESKFLNELTLKQDPVVDEQWAYKKEQELRDIIQQHSLATNLELFSVICKQLACELTGKELVEGSWQLVFMSIFRHLTSSGERLDDEAGRNVSYESDGLTYFYSQFVFSAP